MNELDCVVGSRICSSQAFQEVEELLEQIISDQDERHPTRIVWTDKYCADHANIEALYKKHHVDVVVGQVRGSLFFYLIASALVVTKHLKAVKF